MVLISQFVQLREFSESDFEAQCFIHFPEPDWMLLICLRVIKNSFGYKAIRDARKWDHPKLCKSRTVCSPLLLWWAVLIYFQIMMIAVNYHAEYTEVPQSWLGWLRVDFYYYASYEKLFLHLLHKPADLNWESGHFFSRFCATNTYTHCLRVLISNKSSYVI